MDQVINGLPQGRKGCHPRLGVDWVACPEHNRRIELDGLDVSESDWSQLFAIDPAAHLAEAEDAETFFDTFGDRVPAAVRAQLAELRAGMAAL